MGHPRVEGHRPKLSEPPSVPRFPAQVSLTDSAGGNKVTPARFGRLYMKYSLRGALLVLLFASTFASADSFTLRLDPNFAGDNFGFVARGQNFFLGIFGGTDANFFVGFPYAPGSVIGGTSGLFLDGGFVVENGVELDFYGGNGTL